MFEHAYIDLGPLCNQRCNGCYLPIKNRESGAVMREERLRDSLKKLDELNVGTVHFLGGEPFFDPLFKVLLIGMEEASSHSYRVNMRTNGTAMTRNKLRQVSEKLGRPVHIELSADTMHDGNKYIEKVRQVKELIDSMDGVELTYVYFLKETGNLHDLEKLKNAFPDIKIKEGFFYPHHYNSPEILARAIKIKPKKDGKSFSGCTFGSLYISPSAFYSCAFGPSHKRIKNLSDSEIQKIKQDKLMWYIKENGPYDLFEKLADSGSAEAKQILQTPQYIQQVAGCELCKKLRDLQDYVELLNL